jgi:DNA-binding MarR family transcriptional regulator
MTEQHYQPQSYLSRDSVGYLIRRLYTLLLARFEGALAQADLTLTQWIVLIQIRDGLARTASDIANDLGHDSGALTRVVDQLERRGYLQRQRSVADRRVVELRLTPAGHAIIDELLPLVVDHTNTALAPLSKSEFLQLRGYLVRLLDHTQQSVQEPITGPALQQARQDTVRRAIKRQTRPARAARKRPARTRKT